MSPEKIVVERLHVREIFGGIAARHFGWGLDAITKNPG